jgi:hypothetical protein
MTISGPGDRDLSEANNGATSPSPRRADSAAIFKECRQFFLERLIHGIRDAGMSDVKGLEALQRGAGDFFDAMSSQRGRAGFEQAKGLTASRITLVNDAELAITIKLGELSRLLFAASSESMWKLSSRLATLLERGDLEAADNPVGPEGICAGLAEMCGELECDAATASTLLDGIGARLARDLPVMYAELNELLVRRNVHPARRARSGSRGPGGLAATDSSGSRSAADPLAALQRAVAGRNPPSAANSQSSAPAAGAGAPSGWAADPAATAFAAATFNQLIARLNVQQSFSNASGDLFGNSDQSAASSAQLWAIKNGELAPVLSAPQTQAIDMLALIFDAIFANPHLPDAIKVALSRLQIPVLKAAFLDPTFFSDSSHPARALLDEIGRSAIGIPTNADADHPLCAQVLKAATAVVAEFDREPDVFDRQTAALETYAAQRDYDLQAATESYIPLASWQERQDIAAARATQVTQGLTAATIPPAVAEFIDQDWRQVLAAVHFENGEDSAAWRDCRQVAEDLVWSIQAKPSAEERQRLAAMIPALLRRITDGLKMIGVSATARTPLFNACFELQTAALHGKPLAADVAALATTPAGASVAEPVLTVLEMESRTLKTLHGAADDSRIPNAAEIDIGAWVQLELPGSDVACGRLCWVSPTLHMHLFGNPHWNFALLVAPQILERQLQAGKASLQTESSLFANAAAAAVRTFA